MAFIKHKKVALPVSENLKYYLAKHNRYLAVPIHYSDLLRYSNAIPLYDAEGEDTLWKTVYYGQSDMTGIYDSLREIYALLNAAGDLSVMKHLYIDRVDLCSYGNSKPFRVRVVNEINDNFDYFYVKSADASRVYGLEFEDLLSPNRVSYLVHEQTLVEEHIAGVPADIFIQHYLNDEKISKIRVGKEFVKFNERCFIRLLGDMHSSNFVVNIMPDFEETSYRLRAIDFDQQSYEGHRSVYMPQYFKQNNAIIQMGIEAMTPETVKQYQKEERSLIANRIKASYSKIKSLVGSMKQDHLAPPENVVTLKTELAEYYHDKRFIQCKSMGDIMERSLSLLLE
ncbi:hypothetical protein R9C00_05310 [Flammeovirgaceae bacterium SG7u.111]|nr:hypothetical protein [Flammeovirgaceae bacterium SG7u.132]WPO36863.1 hypothetical protein R9C00_05310 [Flammeovirgaceae bacterium SG7u.111]